MASLTVLVLLVALLVALLTFKVGHEPPGAGGSIGFPYLAAPALFSPAERSFLGALDEALGEQYRIFGKVRIADVASINSGLGRGARQGALNKIAAKHFDFVVCRSSDLGIVCAIELDDKSHAGTRSAGRDKFLSEFCRSIDLPLMRVPAQAGYRVGELRSRFRETVGEFASVP